MKELTIEEARSLLDRARETMGRLRSCLPLEPKDGWTQLVLADFINWRSDYARATRDLGRKNDNDNAKSP